MIKTPISTPEFEARLARLAGEVQDPAHGIFGPESMMWRLASRNVCFICSWRAVLLQLAHPWVAAAVRDHSKVRQSPVRRFHGTFQNVFGMVFGDLNKAMGLARGLHMMHTRIRGDVADVNHPVPEHYSANTVEPMTWVHATLWETLVYTHEAIWGPLPMEDKEAFYQETLRFAQLFGILPESLPADWNAFLRYNEEMWESDELRITQAALDMSRFVGGMRVFPGSRWVCRRGQEFASISLPERLRKGFDLSEPDSALRARVDRDLARLRRIDRWSPEVLRLSSPFQEAQGRVEGKARIGYSLQAINWLTLGKRRITS